MTSKNFGSVEHEGKTLWLQAPAEPLDVSDKFATYALDDDGNKYRVMWPIIDCETIHADRACDWDDFEVVELN